jgi:hypothetical protein
LLVVHRCSEAQTRDISRGNRETDASAGWRQMYTLGNCLVEAVDGLSIAEETRC